MVIVVPEGNKEDNTRKKEYYDETFELEWQEEVCFDMLTEQKFLNEISWVILASGMNDKVVRKVFPKIKSAMLNFESADLICKRKKTCFRKALKIFNHEGKIKAIIFFPVVGLVTSNFFLF
jgi:hypothetical protein